MFFMNGKTLKVVQYNLEFGSHDRFVNVFGCFKYKPNGNIYLIYTDIDTKYNIIYYGSAHIKGNSVLCMQCRDQKKDEEIIKEYIFKVTNYSAMDNFENISLKAVEGIEIIASNKIDVKPEVISSLVSITIPKKEEEQNELKPKEGSSNKKKKSKKGILFLLLFVIVVIVGCYCYFVVFAPKDTVAKQIICDKEYGHDTLNATVQETNTYNFDYKDSLEDIDTVMVYQFKEEDYQEFIMKGTYYKYMPDSDTEGGWDKDDDAYTFKIMTKVRIDTSYDKPTNYEEVLAYYKKEGYNCTEDINKD